MTYYGAKELAVSFRTVRHNTITIAEDIGEEHYGFRAAPDTRTVGQMLVHVALMPQIPLQIHRAERRTALEGFDYMGYLGRILAEEQTPRSKEHIVRMLREEGDEFAGWVETLSDDFLAEVVTSPTGMMPPSRTRFEMLLGVKEHEMHHRAQLMLMERMLGMVPHLTRRMQEFIAARQAGSASA